MDKLTFFSQCLSLLGDQEFVMDSPAARACELWFPSVMLEAVSYGPWSFATKEAVLACPEGNGRLQNTAMVVIGARPAVGKTSFMTNILYNLAAEGVPVGMFSLEMSKEQLLERTLFGMSKINAANLRRGIKLTKWQQDAFTNAVRKVRSLPFFVDDRGALRIDQIQATARRMVADHGVRCIGVDYLQLANPTGRQSSREREVSEISAGLKALAKELNIPVIVLAQLNREAEKRAGKEAGVPRVSDLRDSGSIEQDADQILLLYRPYVMDKNADPAEAKIIVGKNRFGEIGYIDLKWDAAATTYREV